MAERRMFAKTIIDSDAFLDMPISARLLYYDLGMRADDDGFVNSPKKIMRMIGATEDDMRILGVRKFIIPFENGIVVIKHWKIHNYIRRDTYNETKYIEEKKQLELDENSSYRLKSTCRDISVDVPSTSRGRVVDESSTQVRLGKDRIGKDRIDKYIPTHEDDINSLGEYGRVKLTDKEYDKLVSDYSEDIIQKAIKYLDEYIEDKGYKNKAPTHNLTIRRWVIDAVKEKQPKQNKADELQSAYDMMKEWSET